ncbi:DUF3293 domain-containing protein [Veronia pacifica]|uniref:DUF3293 domain-containing protein n=1 Tax=Veronia pacifica TaxID=1080227 RepID=A0A1C3EGU3_9GAMM|nr:DUF3293 domain-containing protein [Veronia pacifica]ODA32455.1 hypothetical protein A8L45_12725 [Veronia pacifica]
MSDKTELWQFYQMVKFEALEPINFRRFGVITACNPGSEPLSDAVNAQRNRDMVAEFITKGWRYMAVNVGSPDMTWCEPSFVVEASQADLHRVSKKTQQNAYYWVDNGMLILVPVNLAPEFQPVVIGRFEHSVVESMK